MDAGTDIRRQQLELLGEIVSGGAPSRDGDGPSGRRQAVKQGATSLMRVDHRDIEPAAGNRPSGMDPDAIAELAASILALGLRQPLVVRETGKGTFGAAKVRIVDGERRWRAIGLLIADGRWAADRKVPCLPSKLEAFGEALARLTLNLQREDLNPLDECELVAAAVAEAAVEHGEKSTAIVAGLLGKKLRWVQIRVRVSDKLGAMDKARLRAGEIGIGEARRLVAEPRSEGVAGPRADNLAESQTSDDTKFPAAVAPAESSPASDGGAVSLSDDGHTEAAPPGGGNPIGDGVPGTLPSEPPSSTTGAPVAVRDGSDPDAIAAVNAKLGAHAEASDWRKPQSCPPYPLPVTHTRLVRAISLDVVPTQATFDAGDPFPLRLMLADPRDGLCVDYVREVSSEKREAERQELKALLARAHRFILADRDTFYDSVTNVDGEFDPGDDGGAAARAALAEYDDMLDAIRAALPAYPFGNDEQDSMRGGAAAARVAHNHVGREHAAHDVAGSSPAPATSSVPAAPTVDDGTAPRDGTTENASLLGDASAVDAPAAPTVSCETAGAMDLRGRLKAGAAKLCDEWLEIPAFLRRDKNNRTPLEAARDRSRESK